MFIVEHNIALRTSDHLVSLLKTICPESDVIRNISCNRTKATEIVCNVIGEYSCMNLIDRMKNNLFSIMIDESIDKSNTQCRNIHPGRRGNAPENGLHCYFVALFIIFTIFNFYIPNTYCIVRICDNYVYCVR